MFVNPGGKLKGLAKAIFIIIIVLFAIGALGLVIGAITNFAKGNLGGGIAMIIGAIISVGLGIISGWLSSITLYAFGQLVEDNQKTRMIIEGKFGSSVATPAPQAPAAPVAPVAPVAAPVEAAPAQAPADEEDLLADIPTVEEAPQEPVAPEAPQEPEKFPDGWTCPSCGERNPKVVKICIKCNASKNDTVASKTCPTCGTKAENGQLFCRNCGTKL